DAMKSAVLRHDSGRDFKPSSSWPTSMLSKAIVNFLPIGLGIITWPGIGGTASLFFVEKITTGSLCGRAKTFPFRIVARPPRTRQFRMHLRRRFVSRLSHAYQFAPSPDRRS